MRAAAAAGAKQGAKPSAQQQPRAVGSLGDELIRRPFGDIWKEVKVFSLNTWLGIDPNTEDPEKQQRLAAIHRGYEKLDQEQQAYARQLVQQREQQKKQQLEEEQRKKQFEQQQREQSSIQAPSSPQKGPVGPASGKSRKSNAITQMTPESSALGSGSGRQLDRFTKEVTGVQSKQVVMTPRFTFPTIARENKLSDMLGLISMRSLASGFILILIVYAFFSGIMTQFYASAVLVLFFDPQHVDFSRYAWCFSNSHPHSTAVDSPSSQKPKHWRVSRRNWRFATFFLQQKKLKQQFDFGNSTFLSI